MNGKQHMTLRTGGSIKVFRDGHLKEIDWPVVAFEPFDEAVAKLQAFESVQDKSTGSAKGETATQKRLRREIYADFLGPLRDMAELQKINDPALIVDSYIERHGDFDTQVDNAATAADKYPDLLVNYLANPNFVVELRAALAALRASRDSREQLWVSRSGATGGIEAAEKELRERIRALDAALEAKLRNNLPLLANWKVVSRIRKTRTTPRPGGDATPPGDEGTPG
jgi:hypothetical protein